MCPDSAGVVSMGMGVIGSVRVLLVVMVVLVGVKGVWVRSMVIRMLLPGFREYIILQCAVVRLISRRCRVWDLRNFRYA